MRVEPTSLWPNQRTALRCPLPWDVYRRSSAHLTERNARWLVVLSPTLNNGNTIPIKEKVGPRSVAARHANGTLTGGHFLSSRQIGACKDARR